MAMNEKLDPELATKHRDFLRTAEEAELAVDNFRRSREEWT